MQNSQINSCLKSYKYEIFGAVQGVGFRPFIYSLAKKYNLFGEVYNDSEGVKIYINLDQESLKKFENDLKNNLPPLARIDKIKKAEIPFKDFSDFKIIESKTNHALSSILPDFAICNDCIKEFKDSNNHRFKYPFINCTNCGPRFSIIKSLPYDRINTTMAKFKMCKICQSEYDNPLDRRYHAQPISCKDCGPTLFLKDRSKNIKFKDDEALEFAIDAIKHKKILAIKGIGGFHLVCDARDEGVIKRLRIEKNRPKKPFAIMCKDLDMALKYGLIDEFEKKSLTSNKRPIVLVKSKNNLAPNLAPDIDKLGIFLPPNGVYLRIFEKIDFPLIATSANISGESIFYDENIFKISNCFDYVLDDNKDIINSSDDSIVINFNDKELYLRTSRGINPDIYMSEFKFSGSFLCLGAELKSEFLIYHNSLIIRSPYIGDLKSEANLNRCKNLILFFMKIYEIKEFDEIISDLHPNFFYTKYFEKFFNKKAFKVQHHKAHLLSLIYEHKLFSEKLLGFAFDGTGYSDDGVIYGGEVFEIDRLNFKRVFNFDEFKLLSGENSIKNIYKLAISIIIKYDLFDDAKKYLDKFDKNMLNNLEKIYPKSLNSSSLGRIIDAFGALVFNIDEISYEAQIGLMIEKNYDENIKDFYEFELIDNKINFKNVFKSALKESDKRVACSKFINGIAKVILRLALIYKKDVALSGGVFQNKALSMAIINELEGAKIKYYFNEKIPINDSGISTGQMVEYLRYRGVL